MLLLALAFIKDAAKAVKRICKEAFTEVHDSVFTELLGISMLKVTMFCLRREAMRMFFTYGTCTLEVWRSALDAG